MMCPKCQSEKVIITPVTSTTVESKTKGFGWCKGCLAACIIGPFGWLCGLCGMGKGKTTVSSQVNMVKVCQDCGNQF